MNDNQYGNSSTDNVILSESISSTGITASNNSSVFNTTWISPNIGKLFSITLTILFSIALWPRESTAV